MITIIKPGKQIYTAKCSVCECEFRYEDEDIRTIDKGSITISIYQDSRKFVICPNCKNKIDVNPVIRTVTAGWDTTSVTTEKNAPDCYIGDPLTLTGKNGKSIEVK